MTKKIRNNKSKDEWRKEKFYLKRVDELETLDDAIADVAGVGIKAAEPILKAFRISKRGVVGHTSFLSRVKDLKVPRSRWMCEKCF